MTRAKTKSVESTLEAVARDVLEIETLDSRGRDDLDFHEVSVWRLKTALLTAYGAGRGAWVAP